MTSSNSHSDTHATGHRDRSTRRQWLLVLGLALVSLILGTIGFLQVKRVSGEAVGLSDAIYDSMRLFHMHFENVSRPLPWQLQVARFLAPLVLGVTLLKGFIYAAQSHRHAFLHRSQTGHVVICGLGEKGIHLAREYRQKHRWVVVIEKNSQNEFLSLCEKEQIHYLIGDAAEPSVLKEARAAEAGDIVVVTPDDEVNLRIAVQLCHLAKSTGTGRPNCFVHLENTQLRETVQRHFENNEGISSPVHFFDVYDREARRVLLNLPLDGRGIHKEDQTTVHVVILGFGRMGRSLALRAACMGHFANGRKLRISVIDRTAEIQRGRFLFHYPSLAIPGNNQDAICNVEFHQGIAESLETRELIAGWAAEPSSRVLIFICIEDNTRGLEVALRLEEALITQPDCKLYVRVKKRASLADIFGKGPPTAAGASKEDGPRVIPFGMVEDTCGEEAFKNPLNERIARAIHQRFVEKRLASSRRTSEKDPALRDWDKLTDDLRASNLQQADHLAIKLRAIGCDVVDAAKDYRPAVEQFSRVELDLLAALEHTRWNAERRLAGWKYRAPSDKARRLNENIQTWDDLTPSIQKYDYEAIEDIPNVLRRADPSQKIVRQTPNAPSST